MFSKKCSVCSVVKPLDDFHIGQGKGGKRPDCKKCKNADRRMRYANGYRNPKPASKLLQRYNSVRHSYGISTATFQALVRAEGDACSLCSKPFLSVEFHVDHCHTSGKVRGLVCRDCNLGLGHFKDNSEALKRAAEYVSNRGN